MSDDRTRFLASWQARAPGTPREFDDAALAAVDGRAELRARVAVISMGNSAEAHSSAMAPDIDDRTGIHVATRVADATGARYLGHCPYATDRLDGLAQVWSPACLPFAAFYPRARAFLANALVHAPGVQQLWLISGHGGNGALEPHLATLAHELCVAQVRYTLALRVPPDLPELSTQHAGDLEHSVARALGPGAFDAARFAALNQRLATDLEATLVDEPALGGMAGYYLFGDARFDAVRARYAGVKPSVAQLVTRRALVADAAIGHAVLDHTVLAIAAEVLAAAIGSTSAAASRDDRSE
jgi:creatinine amidohydrolase/Fe(II)-dependent formamide hydrolase-like protein